MNGSPEKPETEDDLFAKAVAAYEAGDLARARDLFKLVVQRGGSRRQEAERYLAQIAERLGPVTRGGPRRREVIFGATPPPPAAEPATPPPASPEGAADASQELRRTPHMDIAPPPPVAPGTWLKVAVYTDTGPFQAGEEGEEIVLKDADRFDLDVWLTVGPPFAVEGSAVKRLTILRSEERSQPVQFLVQRQDAAGPAPETALFSALFAYNGRPCGRVSRAVPVAAKAPSEPVGEPIPEPGIRIDGDATAPDLSVRIVRTGTDERLFDCLVQTPLLPDYARGKTEPWRLSSLAVDLVKEKMALFTAKNASNFARTAALRSAGMEFFEASPGIFQKVFWQLIDAGKPPKAISIVTEEPSIPWELMVPTRDGGAEEREEPLGIEFLVSRWTSRTHILPPQRIPLRDAYVVAPRDSRLVNAEEEVAMVEEKFPGQRIDPAGMQALDASLGQQGRTLLHFICHGKSGEAGSQILILEQREELNASLLRAMPGVKKAFRAGKPLVFLNACEVGRQEPALVGAGGFAEIFMALGASGVIAPLWSVKDSIAHEIAKTFYERVKEKPSVPFSQILGELRKKSYAAGGGEDTWAAYCFYGDPLAAWAETP